MAQLTGPRGSGSIRADGLGKAFRHTVALLEVGFSVSSGKVVAVVGPNGSGKSTLLRILAGVLTPDRGSVLVSGEPPGHGQAGYAGPGDRGLYWRLTGRQNLDFFARVGGVRASETERVVSGIAEALGAEDQLSTRIAVSSTGRRRRLTLAQAFVAGSPVVLLDEPFADLDEDGCRALSSTVRSWADRGGVVLYATPVPAGGPEPDLTFSLRDGRLDPAA